MSALSPRNMRGKTIGEQVAFPGILPFFRGKEVQPPEEVGTPYVDQAAVDRQTRDLARRRRGVAANQIAGDTGPGTVATAMLGGG